MTHQCFNNCDPKSNGEMTLIKSLPNNLIIFDVGSRSDSEFTGYKGIVHYFEPVKQFLDKLALTKTENTKSYYNDVGLSDKEAVLEYYPRYQSFYNRIKSCRVDDSKNVIYLNVITGKKYIERNHITNIDFLKIDTEGHELLVLKGFEDKLNIVSQIQFEYGGTYLDTNTTLMDVISYLRGFGFINFYYLVQGGMVPITDFSDHYNYCNILCRR
jgi:FkbM family methyltransferase